MSTSESAPQARPVERPITAQRPARNLSTDQRVQATTYNIAREVHTQHFVSSSESTAQLDTAINTLQQTTQERFIRGLHVQIRNTTSPESETPQPLQEVLDAYRQNGNTNERRVLISDLNQLSDEALLAQVTTLTPSEIENFTQALRQGNINQFIKTLPPNSPIRETLDLLHVSDQQLRRLIVEMKTHANANVAAAFNDPTTERDINTRIDIQLQSTRNRLIESMRDQAVETNLDRELRALGNADPIHTINEAHIIHFDYNGQTYRLNIATGTIDRMGSSNINEGSADITQLPIQVRQVILAVQPTPDAATLTPNNLLTLAGVPASVPGNDITRALLQQVIASNQQDLPALYQRMHEIVMTEGATDETVMGQVTTELLRNATDLTGVDLPERKVLLDAQGNLRAQLRLDNMDRLFVLAGVALRDTDVINRQILEQLLQENPPQNEGELRQLYDSFRTIVMNTTGRDGDRRIVRDIAQLLVHDITNLTHFPLPIRQALMEFQSRDVLRKALDNGGNLLELAGIAQDQPGALLNRTVLQQLINENPPHNAHQLLDEIRNIVRRQIKNQTENDIVEDVAREVLLPHITNLTNFDVPIRQDLLRMQKQLSEAEIKHLTQRADVLIRAGVRITVLEEAWRQQQLPVYQQRGAELHNLLDMLTPAELHTLHANARAAAINQANLTDQAIAAAVAGQLRVLLDRHLPPPVQRPPDRPVPPPQGRQPHTEAMPQPISTTQVPVVQRTEVLPIELPFETATLSQNSGLAVEVEEIASDIIAESSSPSVRLEAILRLLQRVEPTHFQGWRIALDRNNPDQIRISNTTAGDLYITPLGIARYGGQLLNDFEVQEAQIPPLMQREIHEYFAQMNGLYRSTARQMALPILQLHRLDHLARVLGTINSSLGYDTATVQQNGGDINIRIPTHGILLQVHNTNLYITDYNGNVSVIRGTDINPQSLTQMPQVHPAIKFALARHFSQAGIGILVHQPKVPDLLAVGTKNELLIQMGQQRERIQVGSEEITVDEARQKLRNLWTTITHSYPYPKGHHPSPVEEFMYAVSHITDQAEQELQMTQFAQLTNGLARYNAFFIPQALGIRPRAYGLKDEAKFSAHVREANEQLLYHVMTGRGLYNRQASHAMRNALLTAYRNAGEYKKTTGSDLFVAKTQNLQILATLREASVDYFIPLLPIHWVHQYHEIMQAYGGHVDTTPEAIGGVNTQTNAAFWPIALENRIANLIDWEPGTPVWAVTPQNKGIWNKMRGIIPPNRANHRPTAEPSSTDQIPKSIPVRPVVYDSVAGRPVQGTLIDTETPTRLDTMTMASTAPAAMAVPETQVQPLLSETDQAIRIAEFRYGLQYAQSKGDLLYTVFLLQTTDHPELRNYYIQQIQKILRETGILTNATQPNLSRHYRILIGNEVFNEDGLRHELALLLDNSNMLSFEGYYGLRDSDFIHELTDTTRPQNPRWHQILLSPFQDLRREGTIRQSLPKAKANAIKMQLTSFQSMAGVETIDVGNIAELQDIMRINFQLIDANARSNFGTTLDAALDLPDALTFLQQLPLNDRILFLSSMFGRAIPQQV